VKPHVWIPEMPRKNEKQREPKTHLTLHNLPERGRSDLAPAGPGFMAEWGTKKRGFEPAILSGLCNKRWCDQSFMLRCFATFGDLPGKGLEPA